MPTYTRPGHIREGSPIDKLLSGLFSAGRRNAEDTDPQRPDPGPPDQTPGQVTAAHRQDVVGAATDEAQGTRSDVAETGQAITATTDEMVREAQTDRGRVEEAAREGTAAIEEQRQELSNLPAEVQESMQGYLDDFKAQSEAGLDEMRSMSEQAIAASEYGRTSAMEAATESIHGAMRDSISQIQSDPTLPPSLKQQMVNQVRMGGATKMSAAIGQTAHQFAQTTSTTITNAMGQIGSVMNTATAVGGQLTGAAMSQVGAAHQAAASLGTQLTQVEAGLRQWEADSQRAVTTSINQAHQLGNDYQLKLLDERQDARSMLTNVRLLDYDMAHRAAGEDLEYFFRSQGFDLMENMVEQGNKNAMIQSMMSGFQSGPWAGLASMFLGGMM